jgi:hypothetical protein
MAGLGLGVRGQHEALGRTELSIVPFNPHVWHENIGGEWESKWEEKKAGTQNQQKDCKKAQKQLKEGEQKGAMQVELNYLSKPASITRLVP